MTKPTHAPPEPGARSRYLAYLLRLWKVQDGDRQVWRASLETPGPREYRGFANLEALISFLKARMGEEEAPDESG